MSEYDASVPLALKKMQEWFSEIITVPLFKNSINPFAPNKTPIESEANKYIISSPTLAPYQRIEIYNQQYWWRLLTVLHDNFPLTTRLLGYYDFNQKIGIPYLKKYPPCHWSINHLGDKIPSWIKSAYQGKDKEVIREAAALDWAYVYSFFAGEYSLNDLMHDQAPNEEKMLSTIFYLQPHLHLMRFKHNLLSFRDLILEKKPEHWDKNPLPKAKKGDYSFVIYRNHHYNIVWSEINKHEFLLLSKFKEGKSIEQACESIENENETFQLEASKNLHLWFQEWTARGWLGIKSSEGNGI